MNEEDIKFIKRRLEELRELNRGVFSGGFYNIGTHKIEWESIGYVCSASFVEQDFWSNPKMVAYAIFDGDVSNRGHKRKGTDVSMAWLKFVLDPEKSFAKNAIPYVYNRDDLEWINEKGGFIIAPDCGECPAVEMKALIIALRQGNEYNSMIHRFKELVDLGIDERFAFPLAARYTWDSELKITSYARSANNNHEVFGYSVKAWLKPSYEGVSAANAPTINLNQHTRRPEYDYIEYDDGSSPWSIPVHYRNGGDDTYSPGAGYFKYTKGMKIEEMLDVMKKHIGV